MMSLFTAPDARPRCLDLAGRGVKDKLMVGGLALLVVAVAVAVFFSIAGSGRIRPGADEMTFICADANCGHVWTMNHEQRQAALAKNPRAPVTDELPRFRCPKCNKASGFQAAVCPSCGKAFVPNVVKRHLRRPVKWPERCPHCGTDIVQWHKDHRSKR